MQPVRAMPPTLLSLLLPTLALLLPCQPAAAAPNDFPTVARVEYVFECMNRHGGKQENLYKCACVIDRIGAQLAYDDYVTMSTALRHQALEGPRGAEFRDPPGVRTMAAKYQVIQADAARACMLR